MKFTEYLEKKMLLEFARRGEVVRSGILLDSDDIEFLEQFPPRFWIRAVYQRYHDDLFRAIKQRHDKRKNDKKDIVEILTAAFLSGDFSALSENPRLFSQDTIEHLKSKYDSDWRSDYRTFGKTKFAEAARNAAEEEAYYLSEKMDTDVAEPPGNQRVYTFKSRNKEYKIPAKPFINRLVHKLERTRGEPHDPMAGLSGSEHPHGMYGFDLDEPQEGKGKIPHSTRGMQLITYDMAKEAVGRLLKHNFHRYYGDLPEGGEEVPGKGRVSWKVVQGEKGELADDTIEEEKKSEIKRDILPRIGNKFTTFRTDPFSITLKDGTSIGKPENSTTVVFKEPGKPPMRHAVSTSSAFDAFLEKIADREWKWMVRHDPEISSIKGPPMPGHGEHDGGVPIRDEQKVHLPHFKKKITQNNKEIEVDMPFVRPAKFFRAAREEDDPQDRAGYRGSVVPIDSDEYMKIPGYGGAAMHPNQNRPREYALPFGVPGYLDLMSETFGQMEKYKPSDPEYPDCYKEIIAGIKSAIKVRSRGVRHHEQAAVRNNIIEMHDIVLSWMKKNLSQDFMRTPEGRVSYARNTTLRILGQDIHRGGAVRTRALEKSARATPYRSLLTPAQRRLIEKLPEMTDQLAEVGRKLISGTHAMPYGRESLASIVGSIKQATAAMDEADPIKSMDHESTDDEIRRITNQKFTRRAPLENAMSSVLRGIIFRESGRHGAELESDVNSAMGAVRKARTISAMVSAFQSLRVVQDFMYPQTRSAVPSRDFASTSTQSAVPSSAMNPQLRGATRSWESLLAQKDYLALVYNYEYMQRVKEETLLSIKSWLDKKRQDGTIGGDDYSEAIGEIEDTLQKRRGTAT